MNSPELRPTSSAPKKEIKIVLIPSNCFSNTSQLSQMQWNELGQRVMRRWKRANFLPLPPTYHNQERKREKTHLSQSGVRSTVRSKYFPQRHLSGRRKVEDLFSSNFISSKLESSLIPILILKYQLICFHQTLFHQRFVLIKLYNIQDFFPLNFTSLKLESSRIRILIL